MKKRWLMGWAAGAIISISPVVWGDVTISAAISLKPALEEAKPLLEKAAGQGITLNYGASGTLAGQIRQGAPVDVFLSADRPTAEKLVASGDADATTLKVFARGELVLVVPADNPAHVSSFGDLTGKAVKKVAIGEPRVVPAGAYAKEALEHLHLWDELDKAQKLVTGENVAQALAYVMHGEVDAGVVYATDARNNPKVKVVATAPADSHAPIEYVGVLTKQTSNRAAAEAVENALSSEQVQAVFKSHGFAGAAAASEPAGGTAR